jgi:hypothetical protein
MWGFTIIVGNGVIAETTSNVVFATKSGIVAMELVYQGASLVAAAIILRNGIDFYRS